MRESIQDRMAREFLEMEPGEREFWLRSRNESERMGLWQALSESRHLTCTDIVELPQPYQAELCRFVVGDPQRGISGSALTFFLEPVAGPVEWQVGTRENRRRMITIDRRISVPAKQAIGILHNLGPSAPIDLNRNKVREWVEREEPEAQEEPKATKPSASKSKKDKEKEKAEESEQ